MQSSEFININAHGKSRLALAAWRFADVLNRAGRFGMSASAHIFILA
jgi:hypothetical protein